MSEKKVSLNCLLLIKLQKIIAFYDHKLLVIFFSAVLKQ